MELKRWMALGLLACGCGSSSSNPTPDAGPTLGSGTLTGTTGQTLKVKDAVFGIMPFVDGVNVVVGDRTDLCSLLGLPKDSPIPGLTTVFGFGLLSVTSNSYLPVATGSTPYFPLHLIAQGGAQPTPGQWWDGAFAVATDCSPTGTYATGGTVNVTQVGSATTHLKVTLDGITFPDGGTLAGSVEAVYCAALQSQKPSCGGASLLARNPATE